MEQCSKIEQYACTIEQAFSNNRSIMERFCFNNSRLSAGISA